MAKAVRAAMAAYGLAYEASSPSVWIEAVEVAVEPNGRAVHAAGCYGDARVCSANASMQSRASIMSMDICLISFDGTRGVLARLS